MAMSVDTTGGNGPETPMGIDVEPVVSWLRQHLEWLAPPLTWTKLAGGHSNLTYRVTDAGGNTFVLRRPPLGELLPSAHDMRREFTIMSALWPTLVPVPEPVAFCDDTSITGAMFYVMRTVEGRSLYNEEEAEAHIPIARRVEHAHHFIDVLADLHAIEPAEVGLGNLGRPDAYVARQLKRWKASWDSSRTADRPELDRLHEFLAARIPEQGTARIAHGDYGLHNVISTGEGRVAAVVDWEISTLGDALADLAYTINSWGKRTEMSRRVTKASMAKGYPTDIDLLERYAKRTGVDLTNIGYYQSFNHWKSACIVDGVLARYHGGQKSTEGVDILGLQYGRDESIYKAIVAAEPLGFVRGR
jgi:aminoglycoside phosphotransferase (APT) family kinase protein